MHLLKQSTFFFSLFSFILITFSVSADQSKAVEPQVESSTLSKSQEEIKWQRWTPAVFEQAKKENKLLLVDFSAEWCQFCKKMDKTTWLDSQVQGSIKENYIPVRVDDHIDPIIAEKYRDYGRPAVVVLKADGSEIAKKRGYLEPIYMYWMLEGVAQHPTAEDNTQ